MKRAPKVVAFGGSLALAVITTMPAHAATNVGGGDIDSSLTTLNLINTNDFHGHFTKDFACTVTSVQKEMPGVTFLSAGDNVGGTPFESASQDDEPAVDYLNSLDLKVSTVGNHEFDKGLTDITGRLQSRADWTYVGANVYKSGTTEPALPEYKIVEQNGVKIGVVGAVTEEVPSLVAKDGIKGLDFGDPVAAVNRVTTKLTDGQAGNGEADVVVAEYHEGAPSGESTLAKQTAASSTFSSIVKKTSPKVAAIFTGHTHQKYAWDGPTEPGTRPVIQTDYFASHLGVLSLGYDPKTKKVTQYKMSNREVTEPTAACKSDPQYKASAKIVDDANKKAAEIGKKKIGAKNGPITTAFSADGSRDDRGRESTLSNMIAQGYVDSLNKAGRVGGVDIGVMNPGGVRAELDGKGQSVTYGEAASIMPFANTVATVDLTGAQFSKVLEEQWQPSDSSRPFLKLGLSKNVTYTYDPKASAGERITSVMVDGKPLSATKKYTIASNSFLLAGGDNFTTFGKGTNPRDSGLVDQSLFVEWIKDNSPLSPSYAKHAVAVEDQPRQVTAGQKVSFKVSGVDLTSKGSPKNTSLDVSLGGEKLGTFPVKAGKSATPPAPSRDSSASVTVTLPAGTPAGAATLKVAAAPSKTVAQIPVQVASGGGSGDTSSPTETPTGPPVETGRVGHDDNGIALTGVAGLLTVLGGGYLVARRRTDG